MCFAIGTVQTLGDVEDDVGAGVAKPLRKIGGGLEPDHLAICGQRMGDSIDGFWRVPFGVDIVRGARDQSRAAAARGERIGRTRVEVPGI